MQLPNTHWLQSIATFSDIPSEELDWFIQQCTITHLEQDAYLFQPGYKISGTHIIIRGKIRMSFQNDGVSHPLIWEEKAIIGYLPFSRGLVSKAYAQALAETELLSFPSEKMMELIQHHFLLTQALVHVMTDRVRGYTSIEQQNEKLMALGKLSAGLAHELNNPASAIVRGSSSLKKHLQLTPSDFKKVMSISMSEEQIDLVNSKLFDMLQRPSTTYNLMERSRKEDEMKQWLDQYHIEQSYELAEDFIDNGFTLADLESFKNHIPDQDLLPIFNWINNNLVTARMVSDIQQASERIFELVSSIKNYTHMDNAQGRTYTDIHEGLSNTLTLLQYKIKKGQIDVVREWDTTLPHFMAYAASLNQVWTNLIDNALDAMEVNGKGHLLVKTEKDGPYIKVIIGDDGPGIPPDIQSRIFEPFFTTKDIGKGTGLGLDVVSRIISQHHGTIKVVSSAGNTRFITCFPLESAN